MNRRSLLTGVAGLVATSAGAWAVARHGRYQLDLQSTRDLERNAAGMPLRPFGRTGLKVSEVGFGAWGIGGQAYGSVQRDESLRALAKAEELGCNLVDTAMVYGDSEEVLGEFLKDRRSRWIISTKYSGQSAGLTATVEAQLRRLGTDVIDFYQLHWVPKGREEGLYDELAVLKKAGKIRFVGLSLYDADEIDIALKRPDIDGFMVALNLLEPDPFVARVRAIHEHGKAVIIRSALREGFLVGKFKRDTKFPDPSDQRHSWTAEQIAETVDRVEHFRFLETEAGSMVAAATRYPLCFPEVSSVVLGTKNLSQAQANFGTSPGDRLSMEALRRIAHTQLQLGLGLPWHRFLRRAGVEGV